MLELDSGAVVAQSNAILWYLGARHAVPAGRAARPGARAAVARVRAGARHGRHRRPALPPPDRPPGAPRPPGGRRRGAAVLDAHLRDRALAGRRRADDRRRLGVRLRATSPPTPGSSRASTSTPGSTACARCPASSPTSSPTARTRGRARAGRSTADVGSPAWRAGGARRRRAARRAGRAARRRRGARARARTSARWGSTPTGSTGRSSASPRRGPGTMPCNLNQRELSDAAAAAVDGGRRRPAPVQHDRGLRQPVAGHAGHARLADLARGDRRLDRADDDRARLRRAALHRRLRQDDAGRADGARARGQAGAAALQRPAARGPAATSAS